MLAAAYRLVDKHRRDGRIDTARKTANNVARRPDRLQYLIRLFPDKLRRRPIALAVAYLKEKVPEYFFAEWRVCNFRMKLNAINAALGVLEGRRKVPGSCRRPKSIGRTRDMIAMAHPDIEFERQLVK